MAEKQYTRQAQEALNMARKIAAELKHPYVGTEHLLFGLKRVFTGVAGQVLDKNKVDEEQMEKAMDILVSAPEAAKKERKHLEYSPRLRYILEESQNEAAQLASEKVGTEHLLLAMLKDGDCVATRMLMTLNVNIQKLFLSHVRYSHNLVLLIFSSAPLAVGREETECAGIKFLLWKTNRKIPQKNWK